MVTKRKEVGHDAKNKSKPRGKRAKMDESVTVFAVDAMDSKPTTSDQPPAAEEQDMLPGFLRLPLELRHRIYVMVLFQSEHPLKTITKATAERLRVANERLEAIQPSAERMFELKRRVYWRLASGSERDELIELYRKTASYLNSLTGLRTSFPRYPDYEVGRNASRHFTAPAIVESALFAVSKQIRAEALACHFSKHTISIKPKVDSRSRTTVRKANVKGNKEVDIKFDAHSEEMLAVARNIHVTVSLNKMWALKNKLQGRTDIKSLTVRFYSEARLDRGVQMVLLAAQCLRQIPVRNKAKMAWISNRTDEEVACAELDDIEPSMLETWMKKAH